MERTDEVETKQAAGGPWLIVHAGGQTYVGKASDGDIDEVITLAPAYRVHEVQMPVEVEPGRMGIQTQTIVRAPLLCVHQVPMMIEPDSIVVLDTLHPDDQQTWMRLIDGAERQQQQDRAARSGITLASSIPKGA